MTVVRHYRKRLRLKIPCIIALVLITIFSSCKTYYVQVESLKEQFRGIDSSQFKEVAIKGPVGEVYKYKANPISLIKCVDNKGNPRELRNSPSLEMRITHNGKKTILYFDRVYVGDSALTGVESRFVSVVRKNILFSEISKIEVQDGGKNFRYVKN